MRESQNIDKAVIVFAMTVIIYFAGYAAARVSHTMQWFDRTTEETGDFTFFSTYSHFDTLLFIAYYPILKLDSMLLNRPYDRDKY